jgi:hypothetical protein
MHQTVADTFTLNERPCSFAFNNHVKLNFYIICRGFSMVAMSYDLLGTVYIELKGAWFGAAPRTVYATIDVSASQTLLRE